MEVASKRYIHDHLSSYKSRGDKHGATNRFVRAQRANNDRKTCRRDGLTKRRGLGLLNEQNVSLEEMQAAKTQKSNVKSKPAVGETAQKENVAVGQVTDQRKAMLMKWREQRELKKKVELAIKKQKTTFTVRHVQYHDTSSLFAPMNTQPTKKAAPKSKGNVPEKRVTRSSARLANKQPVKPVTRGRVVPNNTRDIETTKKPVAPKKKEEQPKRLTRQSARIATSTSSKSNGPSKKKKDHQERNTEEQPCTEIPKQATPLYQRKQQRKSFAPANFQFTAPSGLCTFESYGTEFKFQPMSPASAEDFFQGVSLFPSPNKGREVITKENFLPINTTDKSEATVTGGKEDAKENGPGVSSGLVDSSQSCQVGQVGQVAEPMDKVDVLDGSYFRNLVSTETVKLNVLCDIWENYLGMNEELSEEVKGNIRTAVGQAQLLISQRFKQFSGLIDLSEDETAEKKATMSDLQGFWDMIYFQVEDVKNKMDVLEKQKQIGWVVETQNVKKVIKKSKKIAPKKSEGGKTTKSGAKSKIQEMRAAMKAKMAEKKRQLQSQDIEEHSFVTVLTPVKKNKKSGCNDEVILTPVLRSLRNTPINHSAPRATPKIISTPKAPSAHSPGLSLTPEMILPTACEVNTHVNEDNPEPEKEHKKDNSVHDIQHGGSGTQSTDEEMEVPESGEKESKKDDNVNGIQLEIQSSESATESTDEEMKVDTIEDERTKVNMTEEEAYPSAMRRSCLRSSKRRTRKSSRVFFQSPEPSAQSTAGGTPGPLAFTPGTQTNKCPRGVVFTPVAVSFDSPANEGNTCSIDAGHTPAMVLSGQRSLRCRTSNGTPISGRKRHLATPDSITMGTPVIQNEGSVSKRRSLRRSGKMNTPSNKKETFLPVEYILPSASSESEDELPPQTLTPIFSQQESPSNNHPLLSITPLKDTSDRFNQLNQTPASMFQALNLNDSLEIRRDSVFFTPSGGLMQQEEKIKDNLIYFSPLDE